MTVISYENRRTLDESLFKWCWVCGDTEQAQYTLVQLHLVGIFPLSNKGAQTPFLWDARQDEEQKQRNLIFKAFADASWMDQQLETDSILKACDSSKVKLWTQHEFNGYVAARFVPHSFSFVSLYLQHCLSSKVVYLWCGLTHGSVLVKGQSFTSQKGVWSHPSG